MKEANLLIKMGMLFFDKNEETFICSENYAAML
jgi:hypothetical protein